MYNVLKTQRVNIAQSVQNLVDFGLGILKILLMFFKWLVFSTYAVILINM